MRKGKTAGYYSPSEFSLPITVLIEFQCKDKHYLPDTERYGRKNKLILKLNDRIGMKVESKQEMTFCKQKHRICLQIDFFNLSENEIKMLDLYLG